MYASDLGAANQLSDPLMRPYAQQFLNTLVSPRAKSASERVRDLVELFLPLGKCSMDHIARTLDMDRRTLHRHLAEEGETFSGILCSTRAALAERQLANDRYSITDVAFQLGFTAPSAFSRWFHQQFSVSSTRVARGDARGRCLIAAVPHSARRRPRHVRVAGAAIDTSTTLITGASSSCPDSSSCSLPGDWDTDDMPSVYRSQRAQDAVRQWCVQALARADFPLTTTTVNTSVGEVALTSAGHRPHEVVLVPGTGFNAAVALPWLRALSDRWPTTVVDLPGQPGLSDARRPHRSRLSWYGRVLDEVLDTMHADGVVLVGNSLGGAVALAAGSSRIAARVLVSPAGVIRLSVDPKLVLASSLWLLRPSSEHTRSMLRLFVAPGVEPPETEVQWMTLMAGSCRTTLAPPALPPETLTRRAGLPCIVTVGEHDRFLPPRRLAPALRRTMNLDLRVLPDMGHLTTGAHLPEIVSLVAEAAATPAG